MCRCPPSTWLRAPSGRHGIACGAQLRPRRCETMCLLWTAKFRRRPCPRPSRTEGRGAGTMVWPDSGMTATTGSRDWATRMKRTSCQLRSGQSAGRVPSHGCVPRPTRRGPHCTRGAARTPRCMRPRAPGPWPNARPSWLVGCLWTPSTMRGTPRCTGLPTPAIWAWRGFCWVLQRTPARATATARLLFTWRAPHLSWTWPPFCCVTGQTWAPWTPTVTRRSHLRMDSCLR
mmetsp:Transcript_18230/g.59637  ORF Transcript_18230/g.59637 Transcript_18230/m.59637 type:complete len:231 (-) Transcript_18230:320-1012(-)